MRRAGSYHAFRQWQGWSSEIGETQAVTMPSRTPTASLRVLQAVFAKNAPRHPDEANASGLHPIPGARHNRVARRPFPKRDG